MIFSMGRRGGEVPNQNAGRYLPRSAYFLAKSDVGDGEGEKAHGDKNEDEVIHGMSSSWTSHRPCGKWPEKSDKFMPERCPRETQFPNQQAPSSHQYGINGGSPRVVRETRPLSSQRPKVGHALRARLRVRRMFCAVYREKTARGAHSPPRRGPTDSLHNCSGRPISMICDGVIR